MAPTMGCGLRRQGHAVAWRFFDRMPAPFLALASDPSAGSDVFGPECAECRNIRQEYNREGLHLFAKVERPTGSLQKYRYSDALRQAHWIWTVEKLHGYLSQPAQQANPDTKMKYDDLDDPRQLDDLIPYLGTLH